MGITGLHHITIVAANAQHTIDFYTQVLGLRLVKLTVNFDAPESYHLYFGDETGRPGTAVTFFEWPGAPLPLEQRLVGRHAPLCAARADLRGAAQVEAAPG